MARRTSSIWSSVKSARAAMAAATVRAMAILIVAAGISTRTQSGAVLTSSFND